MLTQNDFNKIDELLVKRIGEVVTEKIEPLNKRMGKLESGIRHVRNDLKIIVRFFDLEYLGLSKRVDRIEDHLQLPESC